MSDTISRHGTSAWLDNMGHPNLARMVMDEKRFPPVQPELHWISVTERLPNRDELVLVTYKNTGRIHLCKYLDDGSENSWWSYINDSCAWNNMILAWMPLPEPFKGSQQIRAKWIHISEEMWKCDQCGEISCCSPNFCPDCGAKMERGEAIK